MIVDASRIGQLRVRVDHSKDMINFGHESDAAPLYVDDEMSLEPLSNIKKVYNIGYNIRYWTYIVRFL